MWRIPHVLIEIVVSNCFYVTMPVFFISMFGQKKGSVFSRLLHEIVSDKIVKQHRFVCSVTWRNQNFSQGLVTIGCCEERASILHMLRSRGRSGPRTLPCLLYRYIIYFLLTSRNKSTITMFIRTSCDKNVDYISKVCVKSNWLIPSSILNLK